MTNGLPRRSTLWPEESTSYADESCFYSGDVHQEKKKKRKRKQLIFEMGHERENLGNLSISIL